MLSWKALESFPNILSFQQLYLFITARTHLPYSHIQPCDSKHTTNVVSQCSSPVCRNAYRSLLDKPHTTGCILCSSHFREHDHFLLNTQLNAHSTWNAYFSPLFWEWFWFSLYGDLNKNGPHRFIYLNVWSLGSSTTSQRLESILVGVGMVLLDEVCQWGRTLGFQMPGCPFYCLLIRYEILSYFSSTIFSCVLPWILMMIMGWKHLKL